MKILRYSLVTASLIVLTIAATAQEKKIERSALPSAVEKTVQTESRGATVKGFTTEVENGKRAYEAKMIVNGHSKDIEIAPDGSINEIEEEVAFNSLPTNVQTELTARAKGAKILKVESLKKKDKLVAYEATILRGSRHGEIQVGPNGERLRHEE
ncbi:MAG TPA: hypothetical protein VFE38_07420 [Edaphobacter sp.]|nr:hypothetical protein [Edaphobacter sp.]